MRLGRGGLLAALAAAVLGTVQAEAHALVRSSDPADGASLDTAPTAVTITFTEHPDPGLSSIHALNESGQSVERGGVQPVPGDPFKLRVVLSSLPSGVYTVNWRTVSAVDGHVAGGAFAFGIGVPPEDVEAAPAPAGTAVPQTPPPSPLGVAGRWLFYAGLGLLVGASWLSLFAIRRPVRRLLATAAVGGLLLLLGLSAMAESWRDGAAVAWTTFITSALGHSLIQQAAPAAIAAVLAAAALLVSEKLRRTVVAMCSLVAAAAIWTHVLASHAPAGSPAWLEIASQWIHLAAFAVWIGGLAGLLVLVTGPPTEDKAIAVRRFSFVAGIGLALVALTGLVRAADQVGAWSKLASTLFGQLVVVKVGLLLALAGLGAVNRFRNVPAALASLGSLRRVGGAELGLAAVLLTASALLTSLAPPSFASAAAAAPARSRLVAEGHDFGTTVRARLEVSPGYAGPNRFQLTLVDYDTRKPIDSSVRLRFILPSRNDVGASALDLAQMRIGTYLGRGTNLSLIGDWQIRAVVQEAHDSVEVPLALSVPARPQRVQKIEAPGQPTLFVIDLAGGDKLQAYLDPGKAGANEVHLTYVDASGQELSLPGLPTLVATSKSKEPRHLVVKRYSQGHFIAQGFVDAGRWHFEATEAGPDGSALPAAWDQDLGAR